MLAATHAYHGRCTPRPGAHMTAQCRPLPHITSSALHPSGPMHAVPHGLMPAVTSASSDPCTRNPFTQRPVHVLPRRIQDSAVSAPASHLLRLAASARPPSRLLLSELGLHLARSSSRHWRPARRLLWASGLPRSPRWPRLPVHHHHPCHRRLSRAGPAGHGPSSPAFALPLSARPRLGRPGPSPPPGNRPIRLRLAAPSQTLPRVVPLLSRILSRQTATQCGTCFSHFLLLRLGSRACPCARRPFGSRRFRPQRLSPRRRRPGHSASSNSGPDPDRPRLPTPSLSRPGSRPPFSFPARR
jgi:hypothetical protein